MTDLYERKPPGPGHNQPEEEGDVKWERWTRRRIFVRELAGTYAHLYKQLLISRGSTSKSLPWKGGPQLYGKQVINPQARWSRNRSRRISRPMAPAPSARSTAI